MSELTSAQHTLLFKLFDGYSRAKHNSFLAELFPNTERTGYFLCFRPVGPNVDSINRYACEYMQLANVDVESVLTNASLPGSITELLDTQLAILNEKKYLKEK